MIESFVNSLKSYDNSITSLDIADILWLATKMNEFSTSRSSSLELSILENKNTKLGDNLTIEYPKVLSDHLEKPSDVVAKELRDQQDLQIRERKDVSSSLIQPESSHEGLLHPQVAPDVRNNRLVDGIGLRSPAAAALPNALNIAQSLRPLMRHSKSRTRMIFDEQSTIQLIAEQQIWMAVVKPVLQRWLSVDLVIDESASMVIWRQTLRELQHLLERHGAFRDVRTWRLVTDAPDSNIRLYAGTGSGSGSQRSRNPRELLDPSGHRLILVASDCVSSAWRSNTIIQLLRVWSSANPVVIVQMLPQRLWLGSALNMATICRLRALVPGSSSIQLQLDNKNTWFNTEFSAGLKMPIVTLEPNSLASWSRMLAGVGGASSVGFIFEENASLSQIDKSINKINSNFDENTLAYNLIQHFRSIASPLAWKLACYLSVMPITLPIIRLVQRTMLPESHQVHLAEVFLGGLLKRVTPEGTTDNPDIVEYDFVQDQIREMLLDTMAMPDVFAVIRKASGYIEEHMGQSFDFEAILRDPTTTSSILSNYSSRPFANIKAKVLRRLGGEYTKVAEALENSKKINDENKQKNVYGNDILPPIMIISKGSGLSDFYISLRPITNVQYAEFIGDNGYDVDEPWWDEKGRNWLLRNDSMTSGIYTWQTRRFKNQPEFWNNRTYNTNQDVSAVVGISWYEAQAFCSWLTQNQQYNSDGYIYRLPMEWEIKIGSSLPGWQMPVSYEWTNTPEEDGIISPRHLWYKLHFLANLDNYNEHLTFRVCRNPK